MPGLDDLVAGFTAGCISRTLTAPADRVKTEMQLSTCKTGGVRDVCRRVLVSDGVRGFFQGNLANCAKVAPQSALFFAFADYFRGAFKAECDDGWVGKKSRSFMAGTMAGLLSQLVIYPLEPVKTCLTVAPKGRYTGIIDCGRQLVATGGGRALFRGAIPTLMGCVPYAGTQLLAYDLLQGACAGCGAHSALPASTNFCCGLASSSVAMTVAYPLMLVRTRLQMQGTSREWPVVYSGLADCFRKTLSNEGLGGLMRGIGPNLAKAAPAAAANFALYEFVRECINHRRFAP